MMAILTAPLCSSSRLPLPATPTVHRRLHPWALDQIQRMAAVSVVWYFWAPPFLLQPLEGWWILLGSCSVATSLLFRLLLGTALRRLPVVLDVVAALPLLFSAHPPAAAKSTKAVTHSSLTITSTSFLGPINWQRGSGLWYLESPSPQVPWVPPSAFIVSFWDWDPCLDLEVPQPHLRSSS